jgi:AbrB family looped-hinge helix DNA binding protein
MRKIDSVNRVVLPKELKDIYGLQSGDPIEIVDNGNGILVKPIKTTYTINESQVDLLRTIYFLIKDATILDDEQLGVMKEICKITDTKCPMCGEDLCVGTNGSYICFACANSNKN